VLVVLPAYNEEARLARLLDRIDASMEEAGLQYEVIVVDDGSRDGTERLVQDWAERIPMLVKRHEANQGLGATIRDGLFAAAGRAEAGDVVVTMDADDTHTPGLIRRMVRMIDEGHDVVIASRYQPGARSVGVPFVRRVLSRGASLLFRVLLPIHGVRDFTCGYRAYRAEVIKDAIAEHGPAFVEQEGFQCMVDILLKLRRRPLIFGEAPLVLRYDVKQSASKMNVPRTVASTLALLLRARLGR
jgi:dolichol-phosphate mannosyltransferase